MHQDKWKKPARETFALNEPHVESEPRRFHHCIMTLDKEFLFEASLLLNLDHDFVKLR